MTTNPTHLALDDRTPEEQHAAEQAAEIARLLKRDDALREKANALVRDVARLNYENSQWMKRAAQLELERDCFRKEALEGRSHIKDRDTINASLRAELADVRRELSDAREREMAALTASLERAS